jgi:hypothetical protein
MTEKKIRRKYIKIIDILPFQFMKLYRMDEI